MALFSIAEVNAPARAIVLRGRCLPYRGAAWGGEQQIDLNWFPGNPVGVVQVIGPRWKPLSLTGTWKDTFLAQRENQADLLNFPALAPAATFAGAQDGVGGETFTGGPAIPTQRADRARALRDAFTLIRKSGGLLRIEWGSLVRYGILTSDNFPHDREEDIEWELEFTITGDTANQPTPLARPSINALSLLKQLLAFLNELLNTILGAAYAQDQWIRRILSPVQEITSLVNAISTTLQDIADQRLATPANVIGTVKSSLRSIVESCVSLLNVIDTGKSAAIAAYEAGSDPVTIDLNMLLQSRFRAEVLRVASEAARSETRLDSQDTTVLRGVYISPGNVSLRDVSVLYYNNPANWRKIAEFNALPYSQVPRGTLVLIPNL